MAGRRRRDEEREIDLVGASENRETCGWRQETVCLPAVAAVFGVRYGIVSYGVCSVCSLMSQQLLSARDGGRSRKKHNSRRCSELSQSNDAVVVVLFLGFTENILLRMCLWLWL